MRHNPNATACELGEAVGSRVSDGSRLARLLFEYQPDLRIAYWLPDGLNARQVGLVRTYNEVLRLAGLHGLPLQTTTRTVSNHTGLHRKVVARSLARLRSDGFILYKRVHGGVLITALVLPSGVAI